MELMEPLVPRDHKALLVRKATKDLPVLKAHKVLMDLQDLQAHKDRKELLAPKVLPVLPVLPDQQVLMEQLDKLELWPFKQEDHSLCLLSDQR
jgi:hypothetical protein